MCWWSRPTDTLPLIKSGDANELSEGRYNMFRNSGISDQQIDELRNKGVKLRRARVSSVRQWFSPRPSSSLEHSTHTTQQKIK